MTPVPTYAAPRSARPHLGPRAAALARARIAASLVALAVTSVILTALAGAAYRVGSSTDSELRFLDPGRPPTSDEAYVAFPVEYSLKSNERNDVLFLGDSVCHHGIDPVQFERLTGLSAFNLGSFGFLGPAGASITTRAYLAHHPKPRAIVVCVTAFSFEVDAELGGGSIPTRFEAAYGPEVGLAPPSGFASLIRLGAQSARNWAAGRNDVRDESLTGMESETYRTLERKWRASRGYRPLAGAHGRPHSAEDYPHVAVVRDDWDRGVQRLADECAAAGVALVIRFCPLSTEFKEARDYSAIESWADGFAAACPHATVARPVMLWWEPSLSWDRIHLNAAGVEKFMPVVARDVRAAVGKMARQNE